MKIPITSDSAEKRFQLALQLGSALDLVARRTKAPIYWLPTIWPGMGICMFGANIPKERTGLESATFVFGAFGLDVTHPLRPEVTVLLLPPIGEVQRLSFEKLLQDALDDPSVTFVRGKN